MSAITRQTIFCRTADTKSSAASASASARLCPVPAAASARSLSSMHWGAQQTQALAINRKVGSCPCRAHKLVCQAGSGCTDEDFVMLGLAHCFVKDEDSKLQDSMVIEPVTAGTYESMEAGAATSYKALVAVTFADAMKMDKESLPDEFQEGHFCQEFDFRCECCTRTWLRPHALEKLVPQCTLGEARVDYNFTVAKHKRVLNFENVVNDSDNVKQDMSIDVYGREEEKKEDLDSEIERLSNV